VLSFSWLRVKVVDTAADMRCGAVFGKTQGLLAEPDVESIMRYWRLLWWLQGTFYQIWDCMNQHSVWRKLCTSGPCFACICCMPSCFNVSWQFTPLFSLLTLIFSLTPFARLYSILLTPYFRWEYHSLFMPTFLGMRLGCKTRAGCTLKGWSTLLLT
jgi:hypothetical protein